MKFGSLLLGLLATAAVSAGTVTGGNTFGIIKLSGITTTNTIVAVPWVNCTDAGNVSVSNLVMTIGLKAGDKVVINDGGIYRGWQLNAPDGTWTPMTSVDATGVKTSDKASNQTLARGQGFFLMRGTGWDGNSFDLYLYGQVQKNAMTAVSAAAGAYTLLSNPTDQSITYASIGTNNKGTPTKGDVIITLKNDGDKQQRAVYNGTNWRVQKDSNGWISWEAADSKTIPAGGGFWYYNKGTEARSFKW